MNDRTAQPVLEEGALIDASVIERVAEKAHEVIDSLVAKADSLTQWEDQWLDGTRTKIREQPLTAVAIGLLAGVLLSRLAR